MAKSRFNKLLYAVVGLALAVGFFVFLKLGFQVAHWQGPARLNLVVYVSDENAGPIEDAVVEIRELDKGPNPDLGVQVSTFRSNSLGQAKTTVPISHGGSSSQFGFGDRQVASLPGWRVFISAPNFQPAIIGWIGEHRSEVRQVGDAEYDLHIDVKLKENKL